MLNDIQLNDLIVEVELFLTRELKVKNEMGTLDNYLSKIGFRGSAIDIDKSKRTEKILIVGETQLKEANIIGIFKESGISKDRIEMISDYDKVAKHDFDKYQYNERYAAILFGPVPHSGVSKNKYSSIITKLENEQGYPKVVRLEANQKLKITNSSLSSALDMLIGKAIIIQNI